MRKERREYYADQILRGRILYAPGLLETRDRHHPWDGSGAQNRLRIGKPHKVLDGKTLFMIFFNPSMRTRNSFEAEFSSWGDMPIFWNPGQPVSLHLEGEDIAYKSERISTLARTLHGMGRLHCHSDPRRSGSDGSMTRAFGWSKNSPNGQMSRWSIWKTTPIIRVRALPMSWPCGRFRRDLRGLKLGVAWNVFWEYQKTYCTASWCDVCCSFFGPHIIYAKPRS